MELIFTTPGTYINVKDGLFAISSDNKRGRIIGLEGSASKVYFDILALCIPERYRFNGRSRQPAKDPFNAFLNYAYGVLYSLVEKSCIIAGLDPYIGFLHTDNYSKPSLVFDIIENFRIYADRVVFRLFSKKMVNDKVDSCYVVYTRDKNKLVQYSIGVKDRQTVLESIREVRQIISRGFFPNGTGYKKRCGDCTYKNICIQ